MVYIKYMTKIKNKKTLVILMIVVLFGALGGFYYLKHKNNDNTAGSGINYGPPTQAEKKDSEDNKKTIDERENQSTNASSSKFKAVTPVIASYGQTNTAVEVSARVPGVLEESGTCTLTLAKGSVKVVGSRTASPNVSEMSCGFISIARSKLSAGNWSATVSYSSSKARGTSSPVNIEVK